MEGTASADGKTITLKGQHAEAGGGHMTHRAVWKILDNNTQTFEMYGTHKRRQRNEDDGDHLHPEIQWSGEFRGRWCWLKALPDIVSPAGNRSAEDGGRLGR